MLKKKSVSVIGSGISGLCSSIFLSKLFGIQVNLYTESVLGKSSSIMAQSGFRAGSGKNGEVIFTRELHKNFNIYFNEWFICLFQFLPKAISVLDIDLSKMEVSNNHIDTLSGLPMYSFKNKNVGVELIKHLLKEVKKEKLISVFENTLVKFDNQNLTLNDSANLYATKLNGKKLIIKNDYIIFAIGGDIGSNKYGFSSNMEYKNYDLHNILFNEINSRTVQFHPFGLKNEKNYGPIKCLPEILAKNGYLLSIKNNEKIQIENFNSRKDCVNWMKKQGGKTFLIPSESNLEIIKKRFRSFLKINDLFGPTLEVHPVAHYLLSSKEFNLNNNFFRVGECRTNAFKLDRPAGMGITQSILSSFDACSIIAQNC